MSEQSMPPWDDELSALLKAERDIPRAPAGLKEEVASRLEMTAQALNVGAQMETLQLPPETGALQTFISSAWVKGALTAALVFPTGVWVGKTWTESRLQTEAPVAIVESPKEPVVIAPPVVPAPVEAPPVPAARLTPAPVEKVKPKESRSTDALLAEERSLLEMARTAMMSGRYKEAAQTLEQHRAKFPKGRLREERESLTIQLLLSSGDVEKARQALEVFSKQFPNSMFLPGLKDALP